MFKRKRVLTFVFTLFILTNLISVIPTSATSSSEIISILKAKLNNGMSVILKENYSAPVVAFNLWVNTGSVNETDKEAGISHLIEHMLFKGTSKRGVGEIAKEVEAAGGDINAYTSFDYTVYHMAITSKSLDLGIDILSDIIKDSKFDPKELENEKEVVLEEIKRSKDRPGAEASQNLFLTAYLKHPYRRPILGYEDTVKSFKREDIIRYFNKWYVPENMSLVIVGDFNSKELLLKVKEAFENIPKKGIPQEKRISEPSQDRVRSVISTQNVKQAFLEMGFHIPDVKNEDVYALDVLSIILGQGESSRLYRTVKDEKRLVRSIMSYSYTPKEPGLFTISATLSPDNMESSLREILQETYRMRYLIPTDSEIRKAKINLESEFIHEKETMQGQARKYGYYESVFGNIDYESEYLKHLKDVSASDILRVSKKYFYNSNLTLSILYPENTKDPLTSEKIEKITREVEGEVVKIASGLAPLKKDIKKVILENGIRVIVRENRSIELVSIRAGFLGGVRFEDKNYNGIFNFISRMLTKGTKKRTSSEIAREVESIGGSISGFSGKNSFGVNAEGLSEYFDKLLELFSDVILNSTFPVEEIEKVKSDILADLSRREDSLSRLAFDLFAKTLYENHPYGFNILGTPEVVKRLTQQDLLNFYKKFAVPKNMVISISGDVNVDDTIRKVDETFKILTSSEFLGPKIKADESPERIKKSFIKKDRKQVHIILGFQGTTIYSPEKYPLQVLNAILSGQGSRLFLSLRDRESLAYALNSFNQEGIEPGSFGVYIATSPEKVNQAINGILRELKSILEKSVEKEELESAKKYLIGTFDISLQTNSAYTSNFTFDELYGLGYEDFKNYPKKIMDVTLEEVLNVARKIFKLDSYVLAIVGISDGS